MRKKHLIFYLLLSRTCILIPFFIAPSQAGYLTANGNSSKILTPTAASFLNNNNNNQHITVVLAQPSSILQNPTEALQAAKRAYPQPQTNLEIKKVRLVEHTNSQNITPAIVKKDDSAEHLQNRSDSISMTAKAAEHNQMKSYERINTSQKTIDNSPSIKQLGSNIQPVMNVSITSAES